MTFQEYWQEQITRGMPAAPADKSAAMAAWDTAICSASAACLQRGKPADAHTIHAKISALHTWANNETTTNNNTPS